MNKQERIAEAKLKVDTLYPIFEKIKNEYNDACKDITNASDSKYEVGDRVHVYKMSIHDEEYDEHVGLGEIIELIRYGGQYKIKLDSGEMKICSQQFVFKI